MYLSLGPCVTVTFTTFTLKPRNLR
jgi:hypothetical protein